MKLWLEEELGRPELIRLGLSVAAMVIFGVLIIWLHSDIKDRAKVIQERRRERALAFQAQATGSRLKIDFEKAKPFLEVLAHMLPTKDLLLQLPKEIGDLAGRQGITLNSLFGEEKNGVNDVPGSVEITFSAQGTYNNIAAFMKGVEQSRYLLWVRRIDMTQHNGTYEAKIFGEVYFR